MESNQVPNLRKKVEEKMNGKIPCIGCLKVVGEARTQTVSRLNGAA